jgi:hypothetical protein
MNDKEFEVVYRAAPENVANIVRALEEHQLHPRVLDDLGRPVGYLQPGSLYSVRIATPVNEREKAAAVLTDIIKASSPQIEEANREMWIFIFAFAISFVFTIAIVWPLYQDKAFFIAMLAGLITAVLTANRNRIRQLFNDYDKS